MSQSPPGKVQTEVVLLAGTLVNLEGSFFLGKWLLVPKESC